MRRLIAHPALTFPAVLLAAALSGWTADYTGPKPPKLDMVYLVHADNLIPTESSDAKEEGKSGSTYSVPGAASTARTPLAEPIFLLQSDKMNADSLELYKLDVKSGHRELQLSSGRRNSKALHLAVTRLGQGLYRIEVDEELDNGEYALTPMGSSRVFCFGIY